MCVLGNVELVEEYFFDDMEVGLFFEGSVEGEDWLRVFEVVVCEVEFFYSVNCV